MSLDTEPTGELAERSFTPRYRHIGSWIETLISSAIGLVSAFILSMDALILAANPTADLGCNVNEKISCGAVAASWQAELFGFPNAFLGLMAEPVIITVAVASLAGVIFPRWFMLLAQFVSLLGFVFAWWLFYESYFVILRLCPYCLLVTATTTLIFIAFTRINILDGHYGATMQRKLDVPIRVYKVDIIAAVLIIAVVAAMIVLRYL